MGLGIGQLYGRWYYDTYTVAYEENDHWTSFFGRAADAIVELLAPATVLDVGCAKGYLVAALRERGVDASGFDVSEVAITEAPESVRRHVHVGSLVEPIAGRFDLVTCIEVIEHLDPADVSTAVAHLCAASDRVLFSSTAHDWAEPTHVSVQPAERWSQLFACHGFFRAFRHDAAYLSPWALLYERRSVSLTDIVLDYDRAWSQLRAETIEQRRALHDLEARFEATVTEGDYQALAALRDENDQLGGENEQLRKEILRLRDLVIGHAAELATALGRQAELGALVQSYEQLRLQHEDLRQRHEAVLQSRSWRLMWLLATPRRALKGRQS